MSGPVGTEGLALFAFQAAAGHGRDIERLVPIARELASRPGGVTVGDLRLEAVARGILTGAEQGRKLSYLGAVMKAAGLVATGMRRRSSVERSHGNLHMIWRKAHGG